MSGRPFDFINSVKIRTFARQNDRCALCGKKVASLPLTEQQSDRGQVKGLTTLHFHHVWPNQVGSENKKSHAWMKTEENCVMLCPPCHTESHEDGNTSTGGVLQPSEFNYSHGGRSAGHKLWVEGINKKIKSFYK